MAHFPEGTVTQNTGATWAMATAAQCSLVCCIGIPTGIWSWVWNNPEADSEHVRDFTKPGNVPATSHMQVPFAPGFAKLGAPAGHVRQAAVALVYTMESSADVVWHGWLE